MSKYQLEITPSEKVQFLKSIPIDYHCHCKYCSGNFFGNIFDVKTSKYYSNLARKKYLPSLKNKRFVHNNPGQFIGYRFAIQMFSKKGDIVFDPTVGTGTAIFEAENNGRKGYGIELEFPETTKYLCEGRGKIIEGNALEIDPNIFLKKESIQILVNGPPYPVINSKYSSDIHSPKSLNNYGDYRNDKNIGKWEYSMFKKRINELYIKWLPYMKKDSKIIIIIKDPCSNKKILNLHKDVVDNVLEKAESIEYEGFFIHRHVPTTFFMNTYEKRTGIKPPIYQTGIVLKKK